MQSLIYSLWFDTNSKGVALRAVKALFNSFHEVFQPDMSNLDDYTPYIQLSDNYFLLVIESHWTPGDICGMIKGNRWIDESESVMAIAMKENAYIPHHGLSQRMVSKVDVKAWESIHQNMAYLKA